MLVVLVDSGRRIAEEWVEGGNDRLPEYLNLLAGLPRQDTKNTKHTCVEKRCMQSPFAFETRRGDGI